MGYQRDYTKAEIAGMILAERREDKNASGKPYSITELEQHPLYRKNREELKEILKYEREHRSLARIVELIGSEANHYIGYIDSVGNECAYTDSMLENIISLAEELKTKTHEPEEKEEAI